MSKLRLMSQNQWNCVNNNEFWAERGEDCSAEVRMKGHVRILKELLPDIVGGQEVNAQMQKYLKYYCMDENLPYTQIWGSFTPLIYRADKLELLDSDFLLYPETVDGYEGCFNDVRSKSCNLGVFRNKESGKVFVFATTHLWWKSSDPNAGHYQHGSDEVRAMQIASAIEMIEKYQRKYDGCPVFLVGDLNAVYEAKAVQYALQEKGFSHAHDIAAYANEENGYNGCGPRKIGVWDHKPFKTAIDHILVRDLPAGAIERFDRYTPDYYLLLSDHAPIYVDVEL